MPVWNDATLPVSPAEINGGNQFTAGQGIVWSDMVKLFENTLKTKRIVDNLTFVFDTEESLPTTKTVDENGNITFTFTGLQPHAFVAPSTVMPTNATKSAWKVPSEALFYDQVIAKAPIASPDFTGAPKRDGFIGGTYKLAENPTSTMYTKIFSFNNKYAGANRFGVDLSIVINYFTVPIQARVRMNFVYNGSFYDTSSTAFVATASSSSTLLGTFFIALYNSGVVDIYYKTGANTKVTATVIGTIGDYTVTAPTFTPGTSADPTVLNGSYKKILYTDYIVVPDKLLYATEIFSGAVSTTVTLPVYDSTSVVADSRIGTMPLLVRYSTSLDGGDKYIIIDTANSGRFDIEYATRFPSSGKLNRVIASLDVSGTELRVGAYSEEYTVSTSTGLFQTQALNVPVTSFTVTVHKVYVLGNL